MSWSSLWVGLRPLFLWDRTSSPAPLLLRSVQMLGALLWFTYGVLINASPVIVANVLVFSAAAWTSIAQARSKGRVTATAARAPFASGAVHPHFESPQFRQVLQPSIMTTAAVLHFAHSCAPSGKCDLEKASVCLVRASNSARFSSTSLR